MEYHVYIPGEALSRYIKCYWTLESSLDDAYENKQRIFPDGCIELIFHYGDLFKKYSVNGAADFQPRSFLHGQLNRYMEIEPSGNIGVFSVRFVPCGLQPFLEMDINEYTGKAISVEEIWGNEGKLVEERMMHAENTMDRIKIIEHFLSGRITMKKNYNSVEHCVNAIIRGRGSLSIDMLSQEVNMGRRHLERKFISSVGLSPKLLSRIIRFQSALQLIERNQLSTLTEIAYAGGFYDQSHLIKDFKEFSGLNPKQYFSADLDFAKDLATL